MERYTRYTIYCCMNRSTRIIALCVHRVCTGEGFPPPPLLLRMVSEPVVKLAWLYLHWPFFKRPFFKIK